MRSRPLTWIAICAVGFSLVLALNAFTLWGIDSILDQGRWPWAAAEMRTWCLPANVLTFALYGIASLRIRALSQRRPTFTACLCLALGSAALLTACLGGTSLEGLFKVAGILLGMGGALSFISWEFSLSSGTEQQTRAALLVASVLTSVPYLALVFLCKNNLVYALTLALVPACIAVMIIAKFVIPEPGAFNMRNGENTAGRQAQSETLSGSPETPDAGLRTISGEKDALGTLWKDLWMPLVCVMMIGIIGPATGQFASLGTMSEAMRLVLYQIANVLASCALALTWFGLRKHPTIPGTFLALTPIIVVSLFLFPFWNYGFQGFVLVLGCAIFSVASVLMMTLAIDLARKHQVGLGVTYGVLAACTYLAQMLGGMLARILIASEYPRQFQVIALIALLIWGLSALAFVVLWRGRFTRNSAEQPNGGTPSVVLAENSGPRAEGSVYGIAASASSASDLASATAEDPLMHACRVLKWRFNLTPREVDVLELLGRGRSTNVIADTLGLSRNTVRSHIQRLYADLNVHDKQELIDVLEAAALDAEFPQTQGSAPH